MRSSVCLCSLVQISLQATTTYIVSSAADSGANTLRQAILDLNSAASSTAAIISINSGLSNITLASNLPPIQYSVSIQAPTDIQR